MDNYYRVSARIDLDAIRKNIITMKSLLAENTKMLAVIKANAYGHGAINIAKSIDDISDYYGLATIEEAIELRKEGISKPLLLLGRTPLQEFEEAIENDVSLTIFDVDTAVKLSQIARSINKTATIHIALDTGMSRIGFQCDDRNIDNTLNDIETICKLPDLFAEGIFTHYAKADEYDKALALLQLEKFNNVIEKLKKREIVFPIKHISNSAGIMEMSNDTSDMVRLGIAMYGLYPSEEVDKNGVKIYPVMSIKTHVSHIKTISKGTSVGYGGTYTADGDTVVATIPVGYADGYPRALSNVGRVLINGEYASIIGRVCMDQFMVDVTHLQDINVDDEVTLVGRDGENIITVEELADVSASFNYEFVCNVSRRVPRLYISNDKIIDVVRYV